MVGKTISLTAGALVALAGAVVGWTTPAGAHDDLFPAAVELILMSQTEGLVSTLDDETKHALVVCVNEVLTDMPNGMKRFVLAAEDYEDMEHRFGKVVLENHAEWKQKIARSCAHIVV